MRPDVFQAHEIFSAYPPPLSDYGRRLLAEGDSWFTIGTLNLPRSSNILLNLEFRRSTAVVSCAYPGHTLQHMVDNLHDPYFDRFLRQPNFSSYWEAVLISGGGNDLIDAAQTPSQGGQGQPVPAEGRLLLTANEVAANTTAQGAARYVSEAGWNRLATYLRVNYAELVLRRDQGPSRGRPLFLHTYAVPVVRPSGTVGAPRGWLYPAMVAYAIPEADWQALAELLFTRLRELLLSLDQGSGLPGALSQVHVFDSAVLQTLAPAAPGTSGRSGDWINEIHLTPTGYRKLGRAMGAFIDTVLSGYP
ncbi:hypothetical protein [Hydrogenophaga sp.]|uniref:hypothetical protein n=1 Tax=Hydrogenophaga sp. TaxID=1904254 RepID=UPI0025BA21B0|nr:hypothetical protein [Hydrogenophaga sp.]